MPEQPGPTIALLSAALLLRFKLNSAWLIVSAAALGLLFARQS